MTKGRVIISVILVSTVLVMLVKVTEHFGVYGFNVIAPIENIEIEGEFKNIALDDLRQEVAVVINGGYFSQDIDAVRNVLMALPWIDDVSVRRKWPSSIHIKVTEKRVVAYWNDDAMISDRGEVFKPKMMKHKMLLPKLNGPEGLQNKMWLFLTTINKDFSLMGFEVIDLSLDDRRAWSLHISGRDNNKIEIKFGRDYAEERLARFVRVFSNKNQFNLKKVEVIDLRYPNGFAMRTKNNSATKHVLVREA